MRVLVTGHRGYIGSVMTCVLRQARFDVVGLDNNLYHGCDFGRVYEPVPDFEMDLREVEFADLLSFDAIVHLAALPEEAASLSAESLALDAPTVIDEVNYEATIRLAECAKLANVSRFVFASSYAVYGRSATVPSDEDAPTNPMTPYAAGKLRCEQELARLADDTFAPVFMRNAEVYGASPRLRMDLTVADLVGSVLAGGRVMLEADAGGWRPLIHVEDLCRAYAAVLTAPEELVRNGVFNVVGQEANYRAIDIADTITDVLPRCTRSAIVNSFSKQSVRADGSRLAEAFPQLKFHWNLALGLRQLHTALRSAGITPGDWRSDRFRRMLRLQRLMEMGELDASLHRAHAALV
jgi:nucleoside-diphosphate-sugar epimerase